MSRINVTLTNVNLNYIKDPEMEVIAVVIHYLQKMSQNSRALSIFQFKQISDEKFRHFAETQLKEIYMYKRHIFTI